MAKQPNGPEKRPTSVPKDNRGTAYDKMIKESGGPSKEDSRVIKKNMEPGRNNDKSK